MGEILNPAYWIAFICSGWSAPEISSFSCRTCRRLFVSGSLSHVGRRHRRPTAGKILVVFLFCRLRLTTINKASRRNGDFDVEDKDRSGRPNIYEDAELEELLEEDSSQTQKELTLTLEVTQQAVSHRLKSLGIIHKQGNWVPYELKRKDVER
ncbi:Mariner Mos1 transposase [Eumeta japonica]|uniref:Mariner Mos1 transposase n=1 Tax=Eumeta variegata TaxID=151549 RepID=A0A4C1VS29_EUMVA|nr:Mariner Mos1 transposase [Eumeta japonica]